MFNSARGYAWSEVHRTHFQLVADLTGVALETELLQEDMRRHERLDRQLSIGAEIQSQLLPDHCPVIDGVELAARCRPAFQVGGDYYDFIPTRPQLTGRRREQGRWALVMGDVMGKGVPAGLLMTLLRGMLRAEVLSDLPPIASSTTSTNWPRKIWPIPTASSPSSIPITTPAAVACASPTPPTTRRWSGGARASAGGSISTPPAC